MAKDEATCDTAAECNWNALVDGYDSSEWDSEDERGLSAAPASIRITATEGKCQQACLVEAFTAGECVAFVYYSNDNSCFLYTSATSTLSTAGGYTYDADGKYFELISYDQAVDTTQLKCSHDASDTGNSGTVARCKYDWSSWGNSGATATRSAMNVCINVQDGSSSNDCVYNPLSVVYDATNSINHGWERTVGKAYAAVASEIDAPADWSSAQVFEFTAGQTIDYPAGAFDRCNDFEDCKMVQCQDSLGDYACRFFTTQEVYSGEDANWSEDSATTTWQRYPESVF
jgi:hypothetical protein